VLLMLRLDRRWWEKRRSMWDGSEGWLLGSRRANGKLRLRFLELLRYLTPMMLLLMMMMLLLMLLLLLLGTRSLLGALNLLLKHLGRRLGLLGLGGGLLEVVNIYAKKRE